LRLLQKGTKKDDVVTFIWQVDEIAALARWSDREWILNVADLVGGHVAPLGRWIQMGLSVGQPMTHERVVQDLMEAYGDGQMCYAVYKKLEQCKQQPKECVVEFKVRLEELFWTLEDEPSGLAKTAKFVTGLLPALNRKLHGKEYSSLAHAVEAVQIEEWHLGEAEYEHLYEWLHDHYSCNTKCGT